MLFLMIMTAGILTACSASKTGELEETVFESDTFAMVTVI